MYQSPNRISAEQRRGYRKGIVLGLTLAEVALLLVFVLLMLLATGFARRDRVISSFTGKLPISVAELSALQSSDSLLKQAKSAIGVAADAKSDDFISLVKKAKEAADLVASEPASSLIEAAEQRKHIDEELQRIRDQLGKDGDASKVIADQVRKNENQQGQIKQLQKQLSDAGAGRVLPSCWTTKDGNIDYIFDVALTSSGLRIKEHNPPGRSDERKKLQMPIQNPNNIIQPSAFISATQRLFQQSVAGNCRFYVLVYDMTGADEKALYKKLLDTVEDHFYKLRSSQTPPFEELQ